MGHSQTGSQSNLQNMKPPAPKSPGINPAKKKSKFRSTNTYEHKAESDDKKED